MEILKDCSEKKAYEPPELEAEMLSITDILTESESSSDSSDSMDGWGKWQF